MSTTPAALPLLAPIVQRADAPESLTPPVADGLTWRPLAREDSPALHGLIAAIEEADAHPYRTSLDEVAEMFDGAWRDPSRDTIVGVDGDGLPCAYGMAETRPGDATVVRAFVSGGVHPQWRARGIGRQVLAWTMGRGRQLLAASGKELPARIAAYVQDSAVGEQRLFDAAGFHATRYYSTLRRSLTLPIPEAGLGEGLRLVPWSPELDEATRLAHNDAFRDHWGSEPATPESWAHGRSMFAPGWSVLVIDETAHSAETVQSDETARSADLQPVVAGYLLSGRYEQDWQVTGHSSGYTETLGVRRAYRGRKIAVALLGAAMAAYARDGIEYAELDVDTENPSGAHGLYASLGYEKVDGSRLLSIEL